VIRDIPAALDFNDVDAVAVKHVFGMRATAQGHHGRVFEEHQDVMIEPAFDPIAGQAPLILERIEVGD